MKGKGWVWWNRGRSRALWGERGMRKSDKVYMDERSDGGKSEKGGGSEGKRYRVTGGKGQAVLLW